MNLRHAAALAVRWFGIFILVILPTISSISGVVLVFYGCFCGSVKMGDLVILLGSFITLAVGLAVCFGRYPAKKFSEGAISQN